ncbi:hypothetical protein [Paracidovorax anthurii]|uniref:Uncharacterized protein n=1 Tax=Paracidovorax anthurii TaxID=78229 RepID=A0A328YSG3_9BURK|nr:hypothetical protein [Paracidovorax anthurii]RAR76354.1 hypothetical protein AX018_10494 [Paracidovorax anthurii]
MRNVPAGIGLLTGRRRHPHWPLDPWHAVVADVLREASPLLQLESYCVALNNAALIELMLGRGEDARSLCLQQIRLLMHLPAGLRARARLFIWQPVINLARMQIRSAPQQGIGWLRALRAAAGGEREAGLPPWLAEPVAFAARETEHPGVRLWLQEAAMTEALQAGLRLRDPALFADALRDGAGDAGSHPLLQALKAEAELLQDIWQGQEPEMHRAAKAPVPCVVALAHLAGWCALESRPGQPDWHGLLAVAVGQLLGLADSADFNHELLGQLALSLARIDAAQGWEHKDGSAWLARAAAHFERRQDEVWEARLLACGPPGPDHRLEALRRHSRYPGVGNDASRARPLPAPLSSIAQAVV